MDADPAQRARVLASNMRWRTAFAVLAVVVPAALFALFRRQEMRLRALADHGQTTTATISHVTRQSGSLYSHYQYVVGGVAHTWSVSRADAPYDPGEAFPVTYLPEDPGLSRPGDGYSRQRLEAELDVPVRHAAPAVLLAFFGGAALLCHRAVRRAQSGAPLRTRPPVSPDIAGRIVAVLILLATLAAGFDPKVRAVQVALMGPLPLGLPAVVLASIVQVVLFAPFFWVMPHLMRIVMHAQARGGALSKLGVAVAVARAPAELRRSRAVVVAGLVYFMALVAAWIALAESRGL